MFASLIRHSFLQFLRSSSFSRNMATLLLLGFLCLLFGAYFLALAFMLEHILQSVFSTENTFPFLCQLLVFYFAGEALMRYFLQGLPVLNLQQYIHLPIGRNRLMHFILLRSYVHPFNLLAVLLFLPYTLQVLAPQLGSQAAFTWWGSMVLLSLIIHNGLFFFKKHLDDKPLGTAVLISLLLVLGASQYFGWFSLGAVTAPFFEAASHLAWLPLALAGMVAGLYLVNFFFLRRHTYPEDWSGKGAGKIQAVPALGLLGRFGTIGELMGLESRLILRHKKPRSMLMLSALILFYGLIFYPEQKYLNEMQGVLLFVGTMITGVFMTNYGQLLISWNSSHYDFFMSKPVTALDYLKAKYYLIAAVSVLTYVLAVPYVYFGWEVLFVNTAMLLFNLGINIFVIMNMSMWSPKKMSLHKGMIMNYEGLGAAQWLMAIPVFGLPYLIYMPFSYLLDRPMMGILALGSVGIIGLLFHRQLLAFSAKRLQAKKYSISHSFRKEH